MVEHFVTVIDSNYIPQLIALRQSMVASKIRSNLHVVCLDDLTYSWVAALLLEGVIPIAPSEYLNDRINTALANRTVAESCWTLTPISIRLVSNSVASAYRVTYIDADIYFLRNPSEIFRELSLSGKSMLITPHEFSPEYEQAKVSGKFCVQFVPCCLPESLELIQWWETQCLTRCSSVASPGHFGDQIYLEELLERFPRKVQVLSNRGQCLAPWNSTRYPLSEGVFWHFHGLKFSWGDSRFELSLKGHYKLPPIVLNTLYREYGSVLVNAAKFALQKKPT